MPLAPFLLGLDIGQVHDPAALAIVERTTVDFGGEVEPRYAVRHLERFPLGTGYSHLCAHSVATDKPCERCGGVSRGGILERTMAYIEKLPRPRDWTHDPFTRAHRLLIDATGVGRPVVELFRHEGIPATAVTMTHGNETVQHDWLSYSLPKRSLVASLQVVMQSRRIQVAESLPDSKVLLQEMQNFQYKINKNAQDLYGAWREGTHDDLLFAVGLCVWYGETHSGVSRRQQQSTGFAEGAGNPLERMGESPAQNPMNPFATGRM